MAVARCLRGAHERFGAAVVRVGDDEFGGGDGDGFDAEFVDGGGDERGGEAFADAGDGVEGARGEFAEQGGAAEEALEFGEDFADGGVGFWLCFGVLGERVRAVMC